MKIQRISLKKKLLIVVLVISTAITSLVFGLTLIYDYTLERNQLQKAGDNVQKSYLNPLALSVWNFDDTQIKSQLAAILNSSEITSVRLRLQSDPSTVKADKEVSFQDPNNVVTNEWRTYELHFADSGKDIFIGFLDVQLNTSELWAKIIKKSGVYLLLQAFKTILLSAILLWVFQRVVTSRIDKIMTYLETVDLTNTKTRRSLKSLFHRNHSDELNKLGRRINRLTHRVAKFHELSDQKLFEKEEQLRIQEAKASQSSKMAALGEMASGIAHEINNPLAVIQANVDLINMLLAMPEVNHDKVSKSLSKIQGTTDRIAKIVRGLRTFSRNSDNDPFAKTNFLDVIQETLSFCSEKIKNHSIELKLNVGEAFDVECRATQISQILLNLLNNAADAIADSPEKWIQLNIVRFADRFEVHVVDSGPGIPIHIQHKIMQPFFTTKEIGKGTGLGLSIARGIAEQHGGSLDLNSQAKNTEFVLTLPYKQAQKHANAA